MPDERCEALTTSMPAELSAKVAPPQDVHLPGPGGELSGLVFSPAYHQEGDRHPAIVWVRGGPAVASRLAWSPRYRWLANEGFVVITLNYRGSTGQGVPHMEAIVGQGLGRNDLEDVLAAASYVKQLPEVDLSRGIGIGGRSWGGYLTLMAITGYPDEFACAYAGSAITDWAIQQSEGNKPHFARWLVGARVYADVAHARERSPISRLENLRVPLLMTHGEEDPVVPCRQARQFVQRAQAAGKDVAAHFYPHEGHENMIRANKRDELARISRFFRHHLQRWDQVDDLTGEQSPF